MARWMFNRIREISPGFKEPNLDSWANEVRLMRERDKRTDEQIRSVFEWANQDDFWQSNILSPAKLREKFDQLTIQMKSKGNRNGRTIASGPGQRDPADTAARSQPGVF